MAKEEVFIPEMERLAIEPQKVVSSSSDENPFGAPRVGPRRLASARCGCTKKTINNTIFKRNHNKLLKEPILKLKGKVALMATKPHFEIESRSRCPLQTLNLETLNVCELVKNDALLSTPLLAAANFRDVQRSEVSVAAGSGSSGDRSRGAGPSCSQQALNPTCDVTIDELASYFETLVHIPKKMSSMAEMMYI